MAKAARGSRALMMSEGRDRGDNAVTRHRSKPPVPGSSQRKRRRNKVRHSASRPDGMSRREWREWQQGLVQSDRKPVVGSVLHTTVVGSLRAAPERPEFNPDAPVYSPLIQRRAPVHVDPDGPIEER